MADAAPRRLVTKSDIYNPETGMEMRAPAGDVRVKFNGLVGSIHGKSPGEWISSAFTDRIKAGDNRLLALLPGRTLFAELGGSFHPPRPTCAPRRK